MTWDKGQSICACFSLQNRDDNNHTYLGVVKEMSVYSVQNVSARLEALGQCQLWLLENHCYYDTLFP